MHGEQAAQDFGATPGKTDPGKTDLATFFEGHHRGLRGHLVRLSDAACTPLPAEAEALTQWKSAVAAGLAGLRAFAELHFADEEKLMEDVAFPGAAEHMREHRAFLAWLARCDALVQDDGGALCHEVQGASLVGWWEAHATDYDATLADFLCRGGI